MQHPVLDPPEGFAHVARLHRLPRRFKPEYLPIVREFLQDGYNEITTVQNLLYHPTYSDFDSISTAGRINAFHGPEVHGQDPWESVKRTSIRYPHIIRFHDGMHVQYNVIPPEVTTSEGLERFLPPPPGKRYLYCLRHESAGAHRGLDKWEVHRGKLDRLSAKLEQFPDMGRNASTSVLVYVVDVSERYLAIDFRGRYNTETLDPRLIVQRSMTSRSGEGLHTIVVPLNQDVTPADRLQEFLASHPGLGVDRTFARPRSRDEPSEHFPISHVVHVETRTRTTWRELESDANHSLRRCCATVRDHLRNEIALVTSDRQVTQAELEKSFKTFLSSMVHNESVIAVWIDPDGSVQLDLYWTGRPTAFVRSIHASFWSPGVSKATQEILRQFENHAFGKLPSWQNQREKRYNLALGLADHLEDNRAFLHVPPPLHPPTYREAVSAVRDMDFLYPFQKETVIEMIARETAQDGFMGLFNTRLSGTPGGTGVFSITEPFTPKATSKTVYAHIDGEAAAALFARCGGILADEPGMGKTRQIAALIKALPTPLATLVVVKPNILIQWTTELETVWPSCRVVVYHGPNKKRVDLAQAVFTSDIVLTTYSTCMAGRDVFDSPVGWGRVVTDESHEISPRFAGRFADFACPMWCVTATPQKKMRSIMEWLMGGRSRAISGDSRLSYAGFWWSSWNWKLHGSDVLRAIMIRKTRKTHLDLPAPIFKDIWVTLNDDERKVYQQIHQTTQNAAGHLTKLALLRRVALLSTVASFGLFKTKDVRNILDDVVMSPEFTDGDPGPPPADDVCSICIDSFVAEACLTKCAHWFCVECLQIHMSRSVTPTCPLCRAAIPLRSVIKRKREDQQPDLAEESGPPGSKVLRMLADIQSILQTPGRKIIVFFSNVATIAWFEELVNDHVRLDSPPLVVHGGVPLRTRQRNFHKFQTVPTSRLMLASVKTVSDGITLTAASDIMLLAPSGRNAVDEQVLGRANRIGRDTTVPVRLWRYIVTETVEEQIFQQQQRWGQVENVETLLTTAL